MIPLEERVGANAGEGRDQQRQRERVCCKGAVAYMIQVHYICWPWVKGVAGHGTGVHGGHRHDSESIKGS